MVSSPKTLRRCAPSIRFDGTGDGLGAKLVWSPLSSLLLYGQTALVYQALRAGVVVSLGTDWSPSGSRNLLDELKIADIALRDGRLLGADRDLVSKPQHHWARRRMRGWLPRSHSISCWWRWLRRIP